MDELPKKEAEYLALAESLVAEALLGFDKMVTPAALQEMHNYLVDELMCTSYGRARLRKLSPPPVVLESGEVAEGNASPVDGESSSDKKKGQIA